MGHRHSHTSLHLPLAGRLNPTRMNTRPEKLYQLLACPGAPMAVAWYGQESLSAHEAQVLGAESAGFKRYLFGLASSCIWLGEDQVVIPTPLSAPFALGAVDIQKPQKRGATAILHRIYVTPEYRRQGIASLLVNIALREFPGLSLDGQLTEEGAALFGYQAALAKKAK